jgi:hypothetical protein
MFFYTIPQLDCPKMINSRSPRTPANRTSYPVSSLLRPRVFGWLLCFYLSFGGHLRPQRSFFPFFSSNLPNQMMLNRCPHMLRRGRILSLTPPTPDTVIWLVVVFLIDWRPSKLQAPLLSLLKIFRCLFDPPNDGKMSHPFVIAQSTVSPPSTLPTPTFNLLLYSPIKWWPPKVEVPAFSLFFDGCHFWRPIQGKKSGMNEPTTPEACIGLMGSRGAMIWVYGGCCHGERGQRCWE